MSFLCFFQSVLNICPACYAKVFWVFVNEGRLFLFLFSDWFWICFIVILQNVHTMNVKVVRVYFNFHALLVTVNWLAGSELFVAEAAMTINHKWIFIEVHKIDELIDWVKFFGQIVLKLAYVLRPNHNFSVVYIELQISRKLLIDSVFFYFSM
jgi:hypothetical protein